MFIYVLLVGDPRWVWRERRLDVKTTDTIQDIKKMLQKEEGVTEDQQTMFFGVKEDKDKIPLPDGTSMKTIAERNRLLPPYGFIGTVTVEVAAPRKSRTTPPPFSATTLMPPPPQPGAGWFRSRGGRSRSRSLQVGAADSCNSRKVQAAGADTDGATEDRGFVRMPEKKLARTKEETTKPLSTPEKLFVPAGTYELMALA